MTHLTTGRLGLRPLVMADLDRLAAFYADPAVMTVCPRGTRTREESAAALERIVRQWQADGFSLWAVEDRRTGAFVGECGLCRTGEAPEAALSCSFAPEHWRQGFAAEAAEAVLAHGFGPLGLDRITASAEVGSRHARRLLRQLRMAPEAGRPAGDTGLVRHLITREAFLAPAVRAAAADRAEAARRERQDRLARALRRNLHRRKEQGRERGPGGVAPPVTEE